MPSNDIVNRRAACRRHYNKNRQYYIDKAAIWRKYKKAILDAYKAKTPCVDCKQCFPAECMDFDHVYGQKSFNISLGFNHSEEKLKEEMAKCQLVCANCHRIRSKQRACRSTD